MAEQSVFSELGVKCAKQILDFVTFNQGLSAILRDEVKTRVSDAISGRINERGHYSGDQLKGTFDDIPDVIEREVGSGLERMRNVVMLMLTKVFAQARERGVDIQLDVPLLEEETRMKASREFCEGLLKKPDEVLEEVAKPKRLVKVPDLPNKKRLAAVQAEIAQLRAQIAAELEAFPQYRKTQALIGERQVEVERLELRAAG